jgi:hypothetical protein
MTPQLTHEEAERLRQILLQHDQQTQKGIKEFDLNNPPKERYRYQEYPRCIYHHTSGKTHIVHNEEQLKAHLAKGWSIEPTPIVEAEPALDAATQAEVEAVDRELRKPKKEK